MIAIADPEAGAVRRPVGVRVIVRVCHVPSSVGADAASDAVLGMSRVLTWSGLPLNQPRPVRNPSRQLGYCGSQPSSRLAFAFDDPADLGHERHAVLADERPCEPAGTCRGGFAPMTRRAPAATRTTGAGSSSTML